MEAFDLHRMALDTVPLEFMGEVTLPFMTMCQCQPVLVVFITLTVLYRLIMWLMFHSEKLEDLLEGKPVLIVNKGELAWNKMR